MGSLIAELARFVKLVVIGLLAIIGAAALLAAGFVASEGTFTRPKIRAAVDLLRRSEEPPSVPAKAAASEAPVDQALTTSRNLIEAERADLRGLQESLRRTADDLNKSKADLDGKWAEFNYQISRPENKALRTAGGPRAAAPGSSPGAWAAPPAPAGPAGTQAPEDPFPRAVRVLAKTDPREAARRLLYLTTTEPAPPDRPAGRVVPHYAEMLRYLRSLREGQAAEILEEMARLGGPGPNDDAAYGRMVAGELQLRLGQLP